MLPNRRNYYLQQLGIETWVLRPKTITKKHPIKLIVVGDAIENSEDKKDPTHFLLHNMLKSLDLAKNEVDIITLFETPSHKDFFYRQIALISPLLILGLGKAAGQFLLNAPNAFLEDMRGHVHTYQETPVLITAHPADLLSQPRNKKNAFKDLMLAKELLRSTVVTHCTLST